MLMIIYRWHTACAPSSSLWSHLFASHYPDQHTPDPTLSSYTLFRQRHALKTGIIYDGLWYGAHDNESNTASHVATYYVENAWNYPFYTNDNKVIRVPNLECHITSIASKITCIDMIIHYIPREQCINIVSACNGTLPETKEVAYETLQIRIKKKICEELNGVLPCSLLNLFEHKRDSLHLLFTLNHYTFLQITSITNEICLSRQWQILTYAMENNRMVPVPADMK